MAKSRKALSGSFLRDRPDTQALYLGVKEMILARVRGGQWLPQQRIPSENELVTEFGVSRMTVNRALRELAQEGELTRVQGSGTFVAPPKVQSSIFEIRNIADEIAERGQKHAARLVMLEQVRASPELADALSVELGCALYYSVIVHTENEVPVQLEERHVNPEMAPDYLTQDYAVVTPNSYLSRIAPWTRAEHEIEAVLPENWEAKLLAVSRSDPCLQIRRRTWADQRAVTTVRLLVPSRRLRIKSEQNSSRR
jgi:GntR family histidine utilization transcriptional repressor